MLISVKCLAYRIDSRNAIPFSGQMFSEHFLWAGLHSKYWMPIWVRQRVLSLKMLTIYDNHIFQSNLCSHIIFSSSLHVHCSMKTNLVPGPGSEKSETGQMYIDPQLVN